MRDIERPLVKVQPQWKLKPQDKGSWREVESWHHEESLGKLLVKVQSSCSKEFSLLEMPAP